MSGRAERTEPDWAAIKGEYVNGSMSLKALADKHGLSMSAVTKHSSREKWSEKRKALREDKAERVSEKLHDRDVKQTVKDIERVCKAAGKLINKVNQAIAQVDKVLYIGTDKKVITVSEKKNEDGTDVVDQEIRRTIKPKRYKGLVDTKNLSEISKTLLNIKQILTGEDGKADDIESSGIIVLNEQDMIDEHEENGLAAESEVEAAAENSVEASAEAGADAAQS